MHGERSIFPLLSQAKPLLQLGLFLFLEHLTISPQHLNESIVKLLADLRYLKSLIILQNEKTFAAKAVDSKTWLSFAERNNHTRIYLIQAGKRQNALLIQPGSPVYAIIFNKSIGQLTNELMQEICYNYSTTLQFFLQKGLERRYRSREFMKRVDIFAIELALRCHNLKLLTIRERMCFTIALLLAQIVRSYQITICLRRNALLKRVNWTDYAVKKIFGSENNQKWIKEHYRNFELFERTIQNITGITATIVTDSKLTDICIIDICIAFNIYLFFCGIKNSVLDNKIVMSDTSDAHDFSITFLIRIIMITLPAVSIIILCQFKKMGKKKQTVLSVSHFSTLENSDSEFADRKQIINDTIHSAERKKTAEQNMNAVSHTSAPVIGQLKSVEAMHKIGETPLWTKTNQSIEYVADSGSKRQKCKNREGKNYQIIGDLDSTDTSYEYSMDNTLIMESLEMIKGKHDLVLEGEEIDHQIEKISQKSDSSDYSLFNSQSSKRDIREQRLRLLRLNTTVARRAAAALEDSLLSTTVPNKKKKPIVKAAKQEILQIEDTQDKLEVHT
ncbi:Protein max [Dirofilaria immitis]